MTRSKTHAALTIFAGLLLCTACAPRADRAQTQTATDSQISVHTHDLVQTVKPGAALQFIHTVDGSLSVRAYSDVTVRVTEEYRQGTVTIFASGSDGLDVLASSTQFQADLSQDMAPWRIAVQPTHDGVHYLTLRAEVSGLGSEPESVRVHSIRLDLGGKTVDSPAGKPEMKSTNDETVAVFHAAETVE